MVKNNVMMGTLVLGMDVISNVRLSRDLSVILFVDQFAEMA